MPNRETLPVIILASASPRRKEILKSLSLPFVCKPVHIKEYFTSLSGEMDAVRLAEKKVEVLLNQSAGFADKWILGGDTIVLEGNKKLGKPTSAEEAHDFLLRLSGRTHQVITGLALSSPSLSSEKSGKLLTAAAITEVTFFPLSENEIFWYLQSDEWIGAAGGYRIQQRGGFFVNRIKGSHSNVVGLPIHTFYGMLRTARYFNI